MRRTRSATVRLEIDWYTPLTFTWSASGLSWRATASKNSRVSVPGGVLRGPPDEIIGTSGSGTSLVGRAAAQGRSFRRKRPRGDAGAPPWLVLRCRPQDVAEGIPAQRHAAQ